MQIISRISCVHHSSPINSGSKKHMFATTVVSNSKLSIKPRIISTKLPTYDTTANLSTTSLSANDTSNLLTAVPANLLATTPSNLSTPTNSNTTTKLTSKWNPKAKTDTTKLKIQSSGTRYTQNPSSQTYLSLLVTPKDVSSNNLETNQKSFTNNIPPATIIEDESLTAIFLFEIEEPTATFLFSEAIFEEKPITVIYTDVKVNGHTIKLIFDSGLAGSIITQQLMNQLGYQVNCAVSVRIIIADRTTKTPISEIDNFLFKVNGIITPIKVLVMEAMQYQALVNND
ncbi:hypothetical protein G9A89_006290 [Geosiphon pyriformis]|nr:hypothetical protein G9A89_006290 [Geosiphon pyriformis]